MSCQRAVKSVEKNPDCCGRRPRHQTAGCAMSAAPAIVTASPMTVTTAGVSRSLAMNAAIGLSIGATFFRPLRSIKEGLLRLES